MRQMKDIKIKKEKCVSIQLNFIYKMVIFLYKIFKIYTIHCRFTINIRIIKFIRLGIPIIVKYVQCLYNVYSKFI